MRRALKYLFGFLGIVVVVIVAAVMLMKRANCLMLS